MGVCVACSSVADDELMQDDLCPNCLGDEAVENDEDMDAEIYDEVHDCQEELVDEE
jgi:RNA polymerase subunit RPABC4/transcription elongation factor Spt4